MPDEHAPVLEKDRVPLLLSKVVHAGCGEYRIEHYPSDAPPSRCPACGGVARAA